MTNLRVEGNSAGATIKEYGSWAGNGIYSFGANIAGGIKGTGKSIGSGIYSAGETVVEYTIWGGKSVGYGLYSGAVFALKTSLLVLKTLGIPHAATGLALGGAINFLKGTGPNQLAPHEQGKKEENLKSDNYWQAPPRRLNELNEVFMVTGWAIGILTTTSTLFASKSPILDRVLTTAGYASLVGTAVASQFPSMIPKITALFTSKTAEVVSTDGELAEVVETPKKTTIELINIGICTIQKASGTAIGILLVGVVAQVTASTVFSK